MPIASKPPAEVAVAEVAVATAAQDAIVVPAARIAKISLSDYRAFPAGPPYEFDLGADGKNLLLYGENGSGKSSLARALRDLFNLRNPPATFAECRHVFNPSEEGAISIQLTAGAPSEYRWDFGEPHPKAGEGGAFRELASRTLVLDYRDLLQTNFVHTAGPPNLFNLLVTVVLESLPVIVSGKERNLGEVHRDMLATKPTKHYKRPIRRASARCVELTAVLAAHLPGVVTEANRILGKLGQPGITFSLNPGTITYHTGIRNFAGQKIEFHADLYGHKITEPQHFLNEARLTALALAIYLGAAHTTIKAATTTASGALPTRLLVLDDVLIGLDVANRLPLLQVIAEDFSDWQVILLTHDALWFEMAREYTLPKKNWCYSSLYDEEAGIGKPRIPRLKSNTDDLVVAARHLAGDDLRAAAVYVRAAFESRLREVAESCDIKVTFKKDPKKLSADLLWQALLRRHAEKTKAGKGNFIEPALISRISAVRSAVLNRLSHSGPTSLTKPEVETALQTIKDFRAVTITRG